MALKRLTNFHDLEHDKWEPRFSMCEGLFPVPNWYTLFSRTNCNFSATYPRLSTHGFSVTIGNKRNLFFSIENPLLPPFPGQQPQFDPSLSLRHVCRTRLDLQVGRLPRSQLHSVLLQHRHQPRDYLHLAETKTWKSTFL